MVNWDAVSFVLASEIRFKIMLSLKAGVKSPTDLKKQFSVPISRVSSVLKELRERELVENLTPTRRKSKLFSLTKRGEELIDDIHEKTAPRKK